MNKEDKYTAEQLIVSLQKLLGDDSAERRILNALYTIINRQLPENSIVATDHENWVNKSPYAE